MGDAHSDASSAITDLNGLVEHLEGVRARAAAAFAAEMFFFAAVADLVQRREAERAARTDDGARVDASQLAMREVYAEIGAALRLSEYQVAARVSQAHTLVHVFTETLYEAGDGRLSPQHAAAIAEAGEVLPDAASRAEYERLALDMARELTASQLKTALGALVDRLNPDGTQERIREAVARRGLRTRVLEPGLSRLTVDAPTAQVEAVRNRLTEIATELHADNRAEAAERAAAPGAGAPASTGGVRASSDGYTAHSGLPKGGHDQNLDDQFVADDRTKQQIMADLALDLLLTGAPEGHGATTERRAELGAIRATVHITIPAATLTGTGTGGAAVIGAGQIDDHTARTLARDSDAWYRYFTDPTTGTPITVDKRRPSKAQKRLLRARDEHCRFPGCRRPARNSDIDHTIAVTDGGPTAIWNLAHLCERHHTVKHHTDWHVEQLPGGVLHFVAPTGRHHTTRPPGAVRFVPDRPPLVPPHGTDSHPHVYSSTCAPEGVTTPPF